MLLNGSNLVGGLAGGGTQELPLILGAALRFRVTPEDGYSLAQPAPALGDKDAVFGAAGLVTNGTWHTDFDCRRVEDAGERRDVLGALVNDAGDFVLIEQHVAGGA